MNSLDIHNVKQIDVTTEHYSTLESGPFNVFKIIARNEDDQQFAINLFLSRDGVTINTVPSAIDHEIEAVEQPASEPAIS